MFSGCQEPENRTQAYVRKFPENWHRMGENSHMQNWQDLRYFHALAQTGSLSAAARQLGVEHATIARRIAALEDATKLKLVDRRGRRLVLTGQGREMA